MEELAKALESGLEEYSLQIAAKNREQILNKFAELCSKYEKDPDDFVDAWMAFAATTGGISEMDGVRLNEFEKQELAKEMEKVSKGTSIRLTSSTLGSKGGRSSSSAAVDMDCDNGGYEDDDSHVLEAYGMKAAVSTYAGTPKSGKKPGPRLRPNAETSITNFSPAGYSPAVGSASVSYASRTKSGDSVLRYKCKNSEYWEDMPGSRPPVKIAASQGTSKMLGSRTTIKYMFQTATTMTATLSAALSETGYGMIDNDDDEDKELQDLRTSSTENCWYFGRIRNEEGRLSQGNIYLEGDMDISGGHAVSLDLTQAEEYRLFPGQAVLMKGKNELGKCLRVCEILTPGGLPMPKLVPKNVSPLNIIVACGPYSPIDSVLYEPYKDLLDIIKRDKPDLCIFIGPFIDITHPVIAAGEVANTFEDVFDGLIKTLKTALQDVQTHVVLIPSFKDAHHHHVYPTPPYSIDVSSSKMSVYPDPSVFEVSGIVFGVTSTDILKHLANNEVAKSTITDRMGGLSKLILSQRSLYPLYPPDESVPLDVQLWRKYCKFTNSPHVIIMPSDLRYFIKDIDGTIVVNPERLTKGKSGGTYARLQIKLPENADGENPSSSVADFCCGEIIKI